MLHQRTGQTHPRLNERAARMLDESGKSVPAEFADGTTPGGTATGLASTYWPAATTTCASCCSCGCATA